MASKDITMTQHEKNKITAENHRKVANQVRQWVVMDGGDTEKTAKWMARTLGIGTLAQCRELIGRYV